ncbi:MAG: type IV pilus modification protein PilV [Gammaproteobacteria bacterium]|nr:type IV pilus modification protein PilV [Gammaproteobacteria bacterium]
MRMNAFSYRYAQGTTLVEVLVAVVIISIGLLGVAALQITALQGANDTQYRSRATDLAASLADRMRANPLADNNYRIAASTACAVPGNICAMKPDDPSVNDGSALKCTSAQIATYDLWEIRCLNGVANTLPGGDLVVTCADADTTDGDACTPNSTFTLNVSWETKSEDTGFTTDNVIMTVIP